jgi:UDP-glucose 4-epimerase
MSRIKNDIDGLRIALTGGTGFVGGTLLTELLSLGARVVALSRRPNADGLLSHPKLTWVSWDLKNTDSAYSALQGIDSICHLAAYIPKDMNDRTEAASCLKVNALGTLGLLEAGKAAGASHFVNISSGQVYARREGSVSETDPAHPTSRATYYLVSKLIGEMYVDHYAQESAFAAANLRLGSVYGPGMSPATTMYRFIRAAREGRPIRLSGKGRYSIDFVFVGDVVSAVMSALRRRVSGTFNVGSGEATSIEELAREIVKQCGADPSSIEFSSDTLEDAGYSPLNIEKARRFLDYSPSPLADGLSSTISAVSTAEMPAMVPSPGQVR